MNSRGLYDIYGIYHIPFWQTKIFFWCIIILFGCLLLLSIIYAIRFIMRAARVETPKTYALKQLALVDKVSADASAERIKNSYFTLTQVLKTYVHQQYNMRVMHYTDAEFVEYIMSAGLIEKAQDIIKQVYDNIEYIKFADQKTAFSMLEHDRVLVKELICMKPSKKN